jgi:hypothetical protein
MESSKLCDELRERWEAHTRLLEGDGAFTAVVHLAEIETCINLPETPIECRAHWSVVLASVSLPKPVVDAAHHGAQAHLARLQRIVGAGSRFIYEELVLVITMRIELDLFLAFARRHWPTVPQLDLSVIDAEIGEIAESPENSGAFASARRACQRNWGLPEIGDITRILASAPP